MTGHIMSIRTRGANHDTAIGSPLASARRQYGDMGDRGPNTVAPAVGPVAGDPCKPMELAGQIGTVGSLACRSVASSSVIAGSARSLRRRVDQCRVDPTQPFIGCGAPRTSPKAVRRLRARYSSIDRLETNSEFGFNRQGWASKPHKHPSRGANSVPGRWRHDVHARDLLASNSVINVWESHTNVPTRRH